MNRSRLCGLLVLVLVLVAAGCRAAVEPPPVYTAENPGPWQGVKITTVFGTSDLGTTLTVSVEGYAATPDDYVQRFHVVGQMGGNQGERVFDPVLAPSETFILDPRTKQVTVTITLRDGTTWTSGPLTVPLPE